MRLIRSLVLALAASVGLALAGPALAACTSGSLSVVDAAGATQTTAAQNCSGVVHPTNAVEGVDGASNLHVLSTDSSGDLDVVLTGTLPAFAATPAFSISGTLPAFASIPTFHENNFPTTVDAGAGASSASTIRIEPTSSAAADGGYAKEAGGHLAAIDTNTTGASTAANQTAQQGSLTAGAAPSKGVPSLCQYNSSAPSPTSGQTVSLQCDASGNHKVTSANFPATVDTGSGASSANTIRTEPSSTAAADGGFAKEAGGHLAAIDTSTAASSTAANQTNVQANAGSVSTKAVGVQGVTSGLPVITTPRVAVVTGTFTPASTGYTVGQDIGGALSVAGGVGNSTPIRIRNFGLMWTAASATAQAGVNAFFFTAAPTTTLADGSVPTWNTADSAKLAGVIAAVNNNAATSTGLFMTNTTQPTQPRGSTTDGSGNINVGIFANGTITYATPGTATYRIEFEY